MTCDDALSNDEFMVPKFTYGLPANHGEPWSEMALADLENAIRLGIHVREVADFLQRTVEEVEAMRREFL